MIRLAFVLVLGGCLPVVAPMPTPPPPPPPPTTTTTAPVVCENLAPAQWIRDEGWSVDCTPPFEPHDPLIRGWADSSTKTVWIWARTATVAGLTKLLDHEHAHVLVEERGLVVANEEQWADGHSYCHAGPQNGVGYNNRPSDCSQYLVP